MTARALRPLTVLAVLFAVAALAAWPAPAVAAGAVALPGEEKLGSDDAADPVEITAGSWLGSIGPGEGGHRFYQYRRTIEKSTVLVSVLASVRTDDNDEVTVAVKTPDGADCGDDYESGYGEDLLAFSTSLRIGLDPDDENVRDEELDPCDSSDTLIIELGRGTSDSTSDLPATLTVIEETPVEDTTGLPPAIEETTAFDTPNVSDAEKAPGGSFEEPTDLESGAAATGTVRTGTAVVYRVPVDWEQSLHARLVLPSTTTDAAFTTVGVNILDPRYVAGYATDESATLSDSESVTATAVAGPVRYLNRVEGGGPYLPGFQYIVIFAEVLEGAQADIDYTLQIEVTGKSSGEPDYGTDEPFVVADGHTAAMITTPGQDSGWASGLSAGWTRARVATVAGLALLGVVSLGGGVHLLRRR